jgi:integrase
VATIIGYRSAISSKHKGWGGRSVSTNGDLSKLIKGIFNSNPILKPLLPNWDLPSVLWRLCDPPFEPLLSCDVKFLTWKTVFLIALATASRVSELHALSVKDGNLRYERHGIRLLPNLQFLSKTQRLNNPWIPIFIPSFHNFATEARDLLLCPYRALKMYIKRTESQRKEIDSDSLFITYQKGVCRPGSKNSVARWIVSLIKWVYQDTSKHLSTVHAHDTRKLATSWALFNGASITEIIRAAHWASESTFTSFYMKDVPTKDTRFARSAILETAKRQF